eukprot:CAMPEP_0177371340 /NCGR_PEP_ID=MMETSP0368-20130122/42467_1 /TAXON_ID=447022 ORGANISM="Scrippsiella hangoei-like, Strain SHHI-4" /NCGR_SAMPLE_ID=MMETSP0368 /ASSEMBLY_ACC=CAM_ASM_000363 /LENGTH=67 /DNA_ID=CAMNT_0018834653 /DNA_START=23 /DNA_END=226 /DNA_ORIENTATION=+
MVLLIAMDACSRLGITRIKKHIAPRSTPENMLDTRSATCTLEDFRPARTACAELPGPPCTNDHPNTP